MIRLLLPLIALFALGGCSAKPMAATSIPSDTTTAGMAARSEPSKAPGTAQEPAKTETAINVGKGERAVLTTNYGVIEFEFLGDKAPKTVENFIKLANQKFYDGTKFHRVIKGFMIQGGDPNTKQGDPSTWGQGGPGYQIAAEFNDTPHEPGIVSMARSSDPDSAGSQFYIVHETSPHLDGQYTAFGRVTKGMDVVNKIANVETGEQNRPVKPVILESVRIVKA